MICLGPIGLDCAVSESFYNGEILQGILFICNSFVKFHGKKKFGSAIYPNPCQDLECVTET